MSKLNWDKTKRSNNVLVDINSLTGLPKKQKKYRKPYKPNYEKYNGNNKLKEEQTPNKPTQKKEWWE